jgi:hypothetical protein
LVTTENDDFGAAFMDTASLIAQVPLWALYLITVGIVLLTMELGWRLGNYRHKHAEGEKNAPISAAVGATLGLLAFLLAFTFGMAATRYDARKQAVLQEANAIGTTYLRTDFLSPTSRLGARSLLREYAALRSGGMASIMSIEGMAKSAEIQDKLWAIADQEVSQKDSVSIGLFVETLNEMIDLDEVRITALRNRIPDTIWLMLYGVAIFSMVALGYEFGLTGTRSWAVTILMVIAFTTVILLIADLDRSQSGLLQISQQPLQDLLGRIGPP